MQPMDLNKLRDFKFFSEQFFKIRTKNGSVDPFVLNRAQLYIHDRLEAQLKETGKVRAIILKGRQQGVSTLVQARYFHKTITNRGIKTFILTHALTSSEVVDGDCYLEDGSRYPGDGSLKRDVRWLTKTVTDM